MNWVMAQFWCSCGNVNWKMVNKYQDSLETYCVKCNEETVHER